MQQHQSENIASPELQIGKEYMDLDSGKVIRKRAKVGRYSPYKLPPRTSSPNQTRSNSTNSVQHHSGEPWSVSNFCDSTPQAVQTQTVPSFPVQSHCQPESVSSFQDTSASTSPIIFSSVTSPVVSNKIQFAKEAERVIPMDSGDESTHSGREEDVQSRTEEDNEEGQAFGGADDFMYSTFNLLTPDNPVSPCLSAVRKEEPETIFDLHTKKMIPAKSIERHGNMRLEPVDDLEMLSSDGSGNEENSVGIQQDGLVIKLRAETEYAMNSDDMKVDEVQAEVALPEDRLQRQEPEYLVEDVVMEDNVDETDLEDMNSGSDDENSNVTAPAQPDDSQPSTSDSPTPTSSAKKTKKSIKKRRKAKRSKTAAKRKTNQSSVKKVMKPRVPSLPRAKPAPAVGQVLPTRLRSSTLAASTPPTPPTPTPLQAARPTATPVEDQDAQDKFSELPALDWKPKHHTSHPMRLNNDNCVYCNEVDSPHDAKFKEILKGFIKDKIRCGHTDEAENQCQVHFHISCILESRPMANHDPHYYSLRCNFGKLVCHDHVCQICHTDRKMRSARNGNLLKVKSHLRAFHDPCRPAGSTLNDDGTLEVFDYTKRKEFKGHHSPACSVCGLKGARLVKCKNCVHSFHKLCNKWDGELCRRCTLDEQTEYGKPVLVKVQKFFRVGKCVTWDEVKNDATINQNADFGKYGFVAIRLDNGGSLVIKELRELQRVPSVIAHEIYKTISGSYQKMNATDKAVELEVLKQKLQARHEEFEQTPHPEYENWQDFHSSLFKKHAYSSAMEEIKRIDRTMQVHPAIEIGYFGGKGRGVKAKNTIPKNTALVEYVGEVISKEEKIKRKTLADRSNDEQVMYYIYDTNIRIMKANKEIVKLEVGIDGSVHHNISGFFNSSCKPNCVTSPAAQVTIVGDVHFEKHIIYSIDAIPADTELTIDYKWLDWECLCGSSICRKPKPAIEW